MNVYKFDEGPQKIRAGRIGEKEFFHTCAACENDVLSGMVGTSPTYEGTAIITITEKNQYGREVANYKIGYYCAVHLAQQVAH